ncbi:GlxA family transcriptional regulator [Albidovulum sediminicola]|uniref:Helix-turn-helix domain-containing protein n=1 Tax=Albidovulum sediminicola TaxID=2984331 RepID=A0ABT2YY37_9RHOB|nr:helix-turn-helix domain-containing protein [Defluviimonas sp. WL0075]MCV2863790.1 helix-turn-helix domain-containing protein [Defluviimonas sp. WL0075]
MKRDRKPVFALLTSRETSPSVLYGLYDVLYSVGAIFPELTVGEPGEGLLDVRIVAADGAPFRCTGNVVIEPHQSIGDLADPDVVIVCDMFTPIDVPMTGKYPEEIAWLRRVHSGGALICAVCSGALVLAESGLLDGREAAAHWAYEALFRRCYPRVKLRHQTAVCRSSEADNIVTAAAVTAWQDLVLYLIARYCGPNHAATAAKVFLLSHHEDGQLPYAAMPRPVSALDAVIAQSQSWIAGNYGCPNPVSEMVERSGLSQRTFARRFRAATGYSPIEYVQALRIEEAKQMLEATSEPIDDIAMEVGYDDPASFRRLFKRCAGITAAAYRRKFQGASFTNIGL